MECIQFIYVLLLIFVESYAEEYVLRETIYGTLRGHTVPISPLPAGAARMLDVFVGVPYAAPPVGELRFLPTEPPASWGGVKDTLTFSPCCQQDLDSIRGWSLGPHYNNTSEDCLYLNIYAPREVAHPERVLPVMVWVHGGNYYYGSGEEYPGEQLAQDGDVIVVTINYRLGVLGFLSTDDSVAPGNYGLLDMISSLRWVRDNIRAFGGDADKVTLFGESAGGAAVSTLVFSSLARGLFQRVIIHSGDALSPWALYRPPHTILPNTQELAGDLGCPTDPPADMVACLRGIAADILVDAAEYIYPDSDFYEAFYPRVDGSVLTSLPEDQLPAGDYARVDMFSGTVRNESTYEFEEEEGIEDGWTREQKDRELFSFSRRYQRHADVIYAAIRHQYDVAEDDRQLQRDIYMTMQDDHDYIAPQARHASAHAQFVDDTYMFSFEHRSDNHDKPEWMGVEHGDEYYYVFGTPLWGAISRPWGCTNVVWFPKIEWTPEDILVATTMITTWSRFAWTGSPSTPEYDWPVYNRSTETVGVITSSVMSKEHFRYSRIRFWNDLVPELLRRC